MRWLVLIALLLSGAARAEEVVLGLSHDEVSISTDFDGSEILIFGAIKREQPIPEGPPIQVIVTVAGPSVPLVVRRKERRFGIWINADSIEVDSAPSFYAVATSAPWDKALSNVEDLRHKVSVPQAIRSVGAPMTISDAEAFTNALIRVREKNGLYSLQENAVEVSQQTLFKTAIRLPANLTEGAYPTRVFLTREATVVAAYATIIDVRKVGLERWLYFLSRQMPLVYGIMSLAIAIAAGWIASAVFRFLRPS